MGLHRRRDWRRRAAILSVEVGFLRDSYAVRECPGCRALQKDADATDGLEIPPDSHTQ